MSLKDVSATLSTSGSPAILLNHIPTQKVLQSLLLTQAKSEHRSFILGTWVKSYRPTARKLGLGEHYDRYEAPIAESRWQDCWVATDEDGYTVYAWVCGDASGLWHVYVIPELRHRGVASCLQLHACGNYTPDLARPWPGRNPGTAKVNPYLLCPKVRITNES